MTVESDKKMPAHYHTKCRRCSQPIIMGENVYPPFGWKPFDPDGSGHQCPHYQPQQQPDQAQGRQP